MTQISSERIASIEARKHELQQAMSRGDLSPDEFVRLSKDYAAIEPVAAAAREVRRLRAELQVLNGMVADPTAEPELKEMAAAEAEDVDVQIDDKDLRIDVYRSSGPGGQSVNTTDSAVRITHLPTGLVVIQQDEKSQHKNKAKALKVLRTRLFELERERLASERAGARKSMVGSGDRSERIRTYNYPQGRITDHRINLTLHKLDEVLEGPKLGEILDALVAEDEAERLAGLEEV